MSMIGKSIAHYEITSQLGKGGMGEVYQAKDRKLGRDVAIKVLPEEFARDADRVARFQREAKLLASLNHPNIAAIYGLEESEGTNFLVLELVEGETLADQLKRGPISVEESLKLALQIAEALEAAHEKGVIHRDLKAANIKVTPDGKVKVLDFGLAKTFAGEQADRNLSSSPTLSNAATQQGIILGTAAYMSPEQARGKAVDKRTDIWAFGCVLYEMLTGQAAFQGEDVTEILAAVVKGGVDLDLLPANLHFRVREVIIRCLQKDLKRRYSSITDARYEIEQALADPSGVFAQPITAGEPRKKLRMILPWVTAAILLGAIIAGVAVWKLRTPEPRQVMRFDYELPEGQQLGGPGLAVSPDGKQFVYSTTKGLYMRSGEELTAKLIAGTEEVTQQPFFSPDGKSIGYFSVADRQLKKIAIGGGTPVALCAVTQLMGACWSADNAIVYGQFRGDIMRVSANGGTPESFIKFQSEILAFPQILPDGKSVLYTAAVSGAQYRTMVQSPQLVEPKELFAGAGARYIPTGHLVYLLSNNNLYDLFAVAFNPDRLEVKGGPVPIVEGMQQAAFSDAGTLAYIPGIVSGTTQPQRTLVWVNREGKEEGLGAASNTYRYPKISPDGTRVALTMSIGGNENIWIWNLALKNLMRLTFKNGFDVRPLWTRDGERIVFSSNQEGKMGVYRRASNGAGEVEQICSVSNRFPFPMSWSADGKILVTQEIYPNSNSKVDIGTLSMEGDHTRKLLPKEDYIESHPHVSPDGRWLAYCSNESGKPEIYVRPFPEADKDKRPVSTNGGNSPLWSPDGRELFYLVGDRITEAAMRVAVETQPTFKSGKPEVLFRGTYVGFYPGDFPWDIHPDGKRFLMIKPPRTEPSPEAAPRPRIVIVLNWFEELKQRAPVK
jgi:eukaryotic-like serine/threonine-protein kinase